MDTPESASSLRGMETQVIRPLMDVALPGHTPSSTPGSSQVSGGSSRLKELHERLQLRNRESPARADLPSTWGEQPVRSVVISSYKKNTEGRRIPSRETETPSWALWTETLGKNS